MAVKIKFISVVVPIESINKTSLSGGLSGLLEEFGSSRGKAFWLDEHLYVEFAMSPADTQEIVERWESLGLTSRVEEGGQRVWKDFCVVDFYQGPTLPCNWLTFDAAKKVAWKSAASPGAVVGPDSEGDPAPLFIPRERAAELLVTPREKGAEMAPSTASSHEEKSERKQWWKFW